MVYKYPDHNLELINSWVKEAAERQYLSYAYYTIDKSTVIDSLYNEAPEKNYKKVTNFLMYAQTSVEPDDVTKFGIDRNREIIFFLPKALAEEFIFETKPYVPKTQDIIIFNGFLYEVLQIVVDKWWAQTDRNLYYTLGTNKIQNPSVKLLD